MTVLWALKGSVFYSDNHGQKHLGHVAKMSDVSQWFRVVALRAFIEVTRIVPPPSPYSMLKSRNQANVFLFFFANFQPLWRGVGGEQMLNVCKSPFVVTVPVFLSMIVWKSLTCRFKRYKAHIWLESRQLLVNWLYINRKLKRRIFGKISVCVKQMDKMGVVIVINLPFDD